jgi:DNA (cytosine-5)-methyltransferase 1
MVKNILVYIVGDFMSKIKAIDLFSGCGGVSCGLVQSGFNVKGAVEIDKDAIKIYNGYKPLSKVKVINNDICNVSGKDILKHSRIKENEIYLLAGCPPCQNFSLQNRLNIEKTDEEKKKLLFEFLRIIKELYPPFILMENVPGIKTSSDGAILNEFLEKLKNELSDKISEQYFVVEKILNAANYGVPQTRRRFVLQAVRKDIYVKLQNNNINFNLPEPTHSKNGINGMTRWVTVGETILDLPEIQQGQTYEGEIDIKNHKCAGLSDENISRMQSIRIHGGSRTGLPDDMVLECHKNYEGHKDVYGIMDANKPAPTITGGCLCYSKGRFGHPTQDRAISIREAARFQTFPDEFVFGDNLSKSGLQIGNAVPVKLVKASGDTLIKIMKQYRKILNEENKRRIDAGI